MKRLVILPEGWPCEFHECRSGFFLWKETLCLMSDYGGEAYTDGGDIFWGGAISKEARAGLVIQPVTAVWEEFEE